MTHPQELIDAARNALISGLKGGGSGKRGVFADQSVAAAIDAVRKWDAEQLPDAGTSWPSPLGDTLADKIARQRGYVEAIEHGRYYTLPGEIEMARDHLAVLEEIGREFDAALADALGKDGE